MDLFDGEVTTADKIDRPQQALDREMFEDANKRLNKAGGGMLVQPSADGSRPGYATPGTGANQFTVMKEKAEKFLKGKKEVKQSDFIKELKKIGYKDPQAFSSVIANRNNVKLIRDVSLKRSPNIEAVMNELSGLTFDYNEKVLKDFNNENMSKTPSWSEYLKNKKLKHGSVNYYQGASSKGFNIFDAQKKRLELAEKLVKDANQNSLKHVQFARDIQPKLTDTKVDRLDTRKYKEIADKLDSRETKVNKAFTYLYENDIPLGTESKSTSALFRNVISDLTGVTTNRIIANGLNSNKIFRNNKNFITFANSAQLFAKGAGKTMKEIIDEAAYRAEGNIIWSGMGDNKKLAPRPNRNVFDYALRHFNYHGKNKTGNSQLQFFYKDDVNMQNPIKWDDIPFDKNGVKKLKASDIFMVLNENPNKQWTLTNVDEDFTSWRKGNNPNSPFNEVYQAKDVYDNLLSEPMVDPQTGEQSTFGKVMRKVYRQGYENLTQSPYAIEHGDTVANNPFKNLRIASQRINSALYGLSVDKKLNKFTRDGLLKILNKEVYSTDVKNIPKIIEGESGNIRDILVEGKKFDQTQLNMAKEKFLTNLDKNKFRRVSKVLVDAAIDGGFGEAVQKICMRKKAKKGGRMFLSNGSGCPAADQDPKGFLRSVSESPVLKKFFTSSTGQKAAAAAARVTGNVLNPSTLIGGEVAFVLADGFNNFSKGMDLAESFDRAFIFKDFKQFDKNIMEQAKNLGYDQNQLNLLNETININRLDNRQKALEYGLDNETPGSEDLTMGFTQRLAETKNQLDKSALNYINTLDKMGFDLTKDSTYDVGFNYLDNVFKKKTQQELLKTYDKRKRQVDPTSGTLGNILDPILDVGAYTQPLKFAADVVNPFTKNVPLLSDRQREAKYLREMDPRELYLYNKQRGFTLDDIEAGTSPQIRQVMEQLGGAATGQGFFQQLNKGGRAGFKSGTLRKGILKLIDDSVKSTPKDTTTALDKLIKKTLDEDLFDKKDRIVETLNFKAAKERKNFPYNQQVFEEPKDLNFYRDIKESNFKTKTGPFFDYQKRKNKAGGGLLKQAGDRSGPPPESGPNPQGLQGLLNRGKNI